ncbi:hypothetical protein [Cerasicoccus maritimus]|uniref:hypothetical protein n=1 Tax=Cerasicoccus maritimus TaxID=490089 RepID=UPI002852B5B5|nr:hypothetical protein [Cerasicoccus maritimus]
MDEIDQQIDTLAAEIATFGSLLNAFGQCDSNIITIDPDTLSELGAMIERRALQIREQLSNR